MIGTCTLHATLFGCFVTVLVSCIDVRNWGHKHHNVIMCMVDNRLDGASLITGLEYILEWWNETVEWSLEWTIKMCA